MLEAGSPVFIALTESGADIARQLLPLVEGAQLHGLDHRVGAADRHFTSTLDHIRLLYGEGRPIIGMCSTAIVIRAIAESLQSKTEAPPVLCVAEDGASVVPLLGGHRGANHLAQLLAEALDVLPAITTAGEARYGMALDSPPAGWAVSNPQAAKPAMAALLSGNPVSLKNELLPTVDISWVTGCGARYSDDDSDVAVHLTERALADGSTALGLHPKTLSLGIGCERDVSLGELGDLIDSALTSSGLARESIACIATIDLKEDEAAIRALAQDLSLPLRLFSAEQLERETHRLANPSDVVFAAVGCHGVAEAAALAVAGKDAVLEVPKRKSRRATVAVARAAAIINPDREGQAPGLLSIVGIGPGKSGWRAPEATDVIARASDVVAYSLYIELLGDLTRSKALYGYALGEERDRCAQALDLAAAGRRVALVSSGDAGIYAMASLVYELIDSTDRAEWRRLAVEVIPGISALQALAARSGAPLGHDFCAISLSDLLTPWQVIENRLKAAAAGDFVIVLYNPVSKRRTRQLLLAKEILLGSRSPNTPVVLGRNLGREEERIEFITLRELESERVDMLTTVMVGSSTTKRVAGGTTRVYTPRGYGQKDATS